MSPHVQVCRWQSMNGRTARQTTKCPVCHLKILLSNATYSFICVSADLLRLMQQRQHPSSQVHSSRCHAQLFSIAIPSICIHSRDRCAENLSVTNISLGGVLHDCLAAMG